MITSNVIAMTLTILLFISPILLTTANAYNVRDVNGKKVINGANYYIRPNQPGPDDGSITWAYNASSAQNCPLFATQGYDTYTPVTISAYLSSSKYISLGNVMGIKFLDNNTPCNSNDQLYWSAMPADDSSFNTLYVVAGYDHPSYGYGNFQIVDSGINLKNVYKFVYCEQGGPCMDVGWLANSSYPYLAMTSDPTMELNPFYFVLAQTF